MSNLDHKLINLKKAGFNRNKGIRPTVRGVAMNPCDHPHGGGNGKTSPSNPPKTPWGFITKWVPTKKRKHHKLNKFLFKNRRG